MPTKTMIHKGQQVVTIPARTELVEVPDPDAGEGAVKLEEQVVEKEKTRTVKLPIGTRFGDYLIQTPYEVTDTEVQKSLAARGFEAVSRDQAKKLDARAEKDEAKLPHSVNEAVAERDRKRAVVNQSEFEPSTGVKGDKLEALRSDIVNTKEVKK